MFQPEPITWRDAPLLLALAVTHWVVKVCPSRWYASFISSDPPSRAIPGEEKLQHFQALGRRVFFMAKRLHLTDSCLAQCILVRSLLRIRGCPAYIRLGAGIVNGELRTHSWVEVGGVAVTRQHGFQVLEVE